MIYKHTRFQSIFIADGEFLCIGNNVFSDIICRGMIGFDKYDYVEKSIGEIIEKNNIKWIILQGVQSFDEAERHYLKFIVEKIVREKHIDFIDVQMGDFEFYYTDAFKDYFKRPKEERILW